MGIFMASGALSTKPAGKVCREIDRHVQSISNDYPMNVGLIRRIADSAPVLFVLTSR